MALSPEFWLLAFLGLDQVRVLTDESSDLYPLRLVKCNEELVRRAPASRHDEFGGSHEREAELFQLRILEAWFDSPQIDRHVTSPSKISVVNDWIVCSFKRGPSPF